MGLGAKSYMRKCFLIYEEMRKFFPICEEAVSHIWLCTRSQIIFLYEENIIFFFISVEHPLLQPEGAGDDGGDHGARQPEAGALPPPLPRLGHCLLLPLARYSSRIHERFVEVSGNVILRVLSLEFSVYNVYISNQFQTKSFFQGSIFWSKTDIYSPPPPSEIYIFPTKKQRDFRATLTTTK